MKRSPIKRKRKKVDPEVVGVQAGWCHDQPCLVCGNRQRTEAHHVRTKGAGGRDSDCVPLCPYHHTLGKCSVHNLGRSSFEEMFVIDLTLEAEKIAASQPWTRLSILELDTSFVDPPIRHQERFRRTGRL